MEEFIQLISKTYGIAGLLLLSPTIAVIYLWRHLQKMEDRYQAALDRVNDVHQKRVDDAKSVSETLIKIVQEHAELSKEINIALERINDTFTILQMGGDLKKKLGTG